jgi:glycosyltransferase involved in cell wall biosynthesis
MPNITLKIFWLFLFNPFKKFVISHNDFHIAFHKKWMANLKLFFIKRANANITVSKSIAEYFKIKAEVIYNCYNDTVFKLYPGIERDKDFVFVGRLVSSKGGVQLLEAFKFLGGNYKLTFIGDGPELNVIKNLSIQYGIENRVSFLGFMHGEELAKKINEFKIMVICPTSVEGFGLVALEGLACGCDLIVSESGGLPEAANGFGRQFPIGNIEALKKCMEELIVSEHLNSNYDEKSNYLKTLTKELVAAKYLNVFKKILNK